MVHASRDLCSVTLPIDVPPSPHYNKWCQSVASVTSLTRETPPSQMLTPPKCYPHLSSAQQRSPWLLWPNILFVGLLLTERVFWGGQGKAFHFWIAISPLTFAVVNSTEPFPFLLQYFARIAKKKQQKKTNRPTDKEIHKFLFPLQQVNSRIILNCIIKQINVTIIYPLRSKSSHFFLEKFDSLSWHQCGLFPPL